MLSVRWGMLCELVEALDSGGLMIVGTFDRISFAADSAPPHLIARMSFAAELECSVFDGSEHSLELRLMDEDHRPLIDPVPLECRLTTRGPGRPLSGRLLVNWKGVQLPRFGTYVIELRSQGRVLWTEVFQVSPVEGAPSSPDAR